MKGEDALKANLFLHNPNKIVINMQTWRGSLALQISFTLNYIKYPALIVHLKVSTQFIKPKLPSGDENQLPWLKDCICFSRLITFG